MKLTFDLEEIQGIEFFNNDVIRVWCYGNPIDITFPKIEFEDWLKYKNYDDHITYAEKDIFEERVKEYLESKCEN